MKLMAAVSLFSLCAFLSGRGKDSDMSTSPSSYVDKSIASAPASNFKNDAEKKATFSELIPKSSYATKGKCKYVVYKYKNADGEINAYEMPVNMTQGSYSRSEWESLFQVYKIAAIQKPQNDKKRQNDSVNQALVCSPRASKSPTPGVPKAAGISDTDESSKTTPIASSANKTIDDVNSQIFGGGRGK